MCVKRFVGAGVHHMSVMHYFRIKYLKIYNCKLKKLVGGFFLEKCACAGVLAGIKTCVHVFAPHNTKMCAICVQVRPKVCAHQQFESRGKHTERNRQRKKYLLTFLEIELLH